MREIEFKLVGVLSPVDTLRAIVERIPIDGTVRAHVHYMAEREARQGSSRARDVSFEGGVSEVCAFIGRSFSPLASLSVSAGVSTRLRRSGWVTIGAAGVEYRSRVRHPGAEVSVNIDGRLLAPPKEARVPSFLRRERRDLELVSDWLSHYLMLDFCQYFRLPGVRRLVVEASGSAPCRATVLGYTSATDFLADVAACRAGSSSIEEAQSRAVQLAEVAGALLSAVDDDPRLDPELASQMLTASPAPQELCRLPQSGTSAGFIGATIDEDWILLATGRAHTLAGLFDRLAAL
jgi:hypothetical protein